MDGSIETITTDLDLGSMAFALEVRGDSMAPEILEGDVVVIDPDVDPLPGDYVVAKNGSHEATLKQWSAHAAPTTKAKSISSWYR